MRIILVDDSNDFRELMVEFLTVVGYTITGFNEPPSQSLSADLFLVDWNIKDRTSDQFIEQLRKDNPTTIIWVLTGNILMPELKIQMRTIGANGVINKPVDPDDLLTLLDMVENNKDWKESKLVHPL